MKLQHILDRALAGERLSLDEACTLYDTAPTAELCAAADTLRRRMVRDAEVVTWQIDRNVNTTNVCMSGCRFCNFHCKPHRTELHYITPLDEYIRKTEEMFALGGDQLLLQGGMHPKLGIEYYEELFSALTKRFPTLRLNALGAPEVAHIARISGISTCEVLERLRNAGLTSLPGAGAEILVPRVRKIISPAKPSVEEWCRVMHEAHEMNIPTTATMMYGHVESRRERMEHLILLRDLQAAVPAGHYGFTAFIPWIFRSEGTELEQMGYRTDFSPTEYLRLIATSRLVLNNISNIQASWLTVGKATAQLALHSGANDMGSIMIEENVVSSAGASTRFDKEAMKATIRRAGFTPRLRDQLYNFREEPKLSGWRVSRG